MLYDPAMLTVFIKHPDGTISNDASAQSLAATVKDCQSVMWLDMVKPTDEEFALLDEVFGFHPLAIEDSIKYSQRPKIESYNHVGDACRPGVLLHGLPRAGPGDLPGEPADEGAGHVRVGALPADDPRRGHAGSIERRAAAGGRPTRGWCSTRGSTCCCTTSSTT